MPIARRVCVAIFLLACAFALFASPAPATTASSELTEWTESANATANDLGYVVWSPIAPIGVEGVGFRYGESLVRDAGFGPGATAWVVNSTLSRERLLLPQPIVFRSAGFTPNGSWFVATFDELPGIPFLQGSAEQRNSTVHFAIWNATSWTLVEDTVIATIGSLADGNGSLVPTRFDISPDGMRLAMWNSALGLASTDRMAQVRSFPGRSLLAERNFTRTVLEMRWAPSGDLIAVSHGYYANESGNLSLVDGSTMTTTRAYEMANSVFSSISWAPNETLIVAKIVTYGQYNYSAGSCPGGWMAKDINVRRISSPALSVAGSIWGVSAGNASCGFALDGWEGGANGSARASFDPASRYLALVAGLQVMVFNVTYWDRVFVADLPGEIEIGDLSSDLRWYSSGPALTVSMASWAIDGGASGWQLEPRVTRLHFEGTPRNPSGAALVAAAGGDVHLLPEVPLGGVSLNFTVDSLERLYSGFEFKVWGPSFLETWQVLLPGGSLTLLSSGQFIRTTAAVAADPWDGQRVSFVATWVATWNVSFSGQLQWSATGTLYNGSSAPFQSNGTIWVHLEVALSPPINLRDVLRGPLADGDFVNANPELGWGFGAAVFTFNGTVVSPSGFEAFLRVNNSSLSAVALTSMALQEIRGRPLGLDGLVEVTLHIQNAQGTAIDVGRRSVWLRADSTAPALGGVSPPNGFWTAGSVQDAVLTVTEEGSGLEPAGASLSLFDRDTNELLLAVAVAASSPPGPGGSFVFEATLTLPSDARRRLQVVWLVLDQVGNSLEARAELDIDRVPPRLVPVNWPEWLNSTATRLSWSCTDAGVGMNDSSGRAAYRSSPAGQVTVFTADASGGLAGQVDYAASITLQEGADGSVVLSCEDLLDNQNASGPLPVRVDISPPTWFNVRPDLTKTLVGTEQTVTFALRDALSGTSPSGAQCAVSVDGGVSFSSISPAEVTTRVDGGADAVCAVHLREGGENRLRLEFGDRAGNRASAGPFTLRVNEAPRVLVLAPVANGTVTGPFVELFASVVDADDDIVSVLWISKANGTIVGNGANASASFAPGQYDLEIRVTDAAGHTVSAPARFTVVTVSTETPPPILAMMLLVGLASIAMVVLLLVLQRRRSPAEEPEEPR